jgi:hypothetical protein
MIHGLTYNFGSKEFSRLLLLNYIELALNKNNTFVDLTERTAS